MRQLYDADDLTNAVYTFGQVLVDALRDRLGVDAETEREEVVTLVGQTTLTVVVSWDPVYRHPDVDAEVAREQAP